MVGTLFLLFDALLNILEQRDHMCGEKSFEGLLRILIIICAIAAGYASSDPSNARPLRLQKYRYFHEHIEEGLEIQGFDLGIIQLFG